MYPGTRPSVAADMSEPWTEASKERARVVLEVEVIRHLYCKDVSSLLVLGCLSLNLA